MTEAERQPCMRRVPELLVTGVLALLCVRPAVAQWPERALVPIRSIDPEDADFSDLRRLREFIGNARIVQLGEQSHGDGATFFAKQRLIRFLHSEMGFNVLAWESGFFDCEEMEQALHTDMPVRDARARGLFSLFADGPFIESVFEYARSTHGSKRPLRMTGFDIQYSGSITREILPARIYDFLSRTHPDLTTPENRTAVTELIQGSYRPVAEEREKRLALLRTITNGIRKAGREPSREDRFYLRVLENIAAFDQQRWLTPSVPTPVEADNFRDRAMAENVLWLANEWYPKEKIIVWSANLHVLRNPARIDTRTDAFSYKQRVTMGHVLSQRLGRRLYTIGFTAHEGEIGHLFMKPRRLPAVPESSLEAQLHALGRKYVLVDIGSLPATHPLRSRMIAWPLGYMPMEAAWSENFDAILYTDVMFPNTKGTEIPPGVRTNADRTAPKP